MSHPSDADLDRLLAEARPVLPAGFADEVMRRASGGVGPIPLPPVRPRRPARLVAGLAVAFAAAAALALALLPRSPATDTQAWRVTSGADVPADGRIQVEPDGHLRLQRGDGAAIELAGGTVASLTNGKDFNLQLGRARLEGAVTVTTPRARVVGAAADALAELNLEPQENPMILKSTTLLAAAAAGSVLTVAVMRGDVTVHPTGPNATPTLALRAGDRARLPAPDPEPTAPVVASTALASHAAAAAPVVAPAAPTAEAGPECPPGEVPADCDGEEVSATPERVKVDADGPSYGPANARVTIIEFSDYQCPFCEKAMSTVHELANMYPKDVRIVLRNFPMPGHKNAKLAAEAALAAGEQGKYWEMHDVLLANQERLDRASIDSYAQVIGLDVGRFKRALDDHRFAGQIDRDIEAAMGIGLKGVPAFVINGQLVVGARPLEDFKQIVEDELK